MTKMMKIFTTETQAKAYVATQGGKLTVRYEWDDMKREIVKTYIVKF